MKRYLLLFALGATLASCQHDPFSDDVMLGSYDPQQVISIVPESVEFEQDQTRGTPITSITQMTDMGVYCAYTATSNWSVLSLPDKMFNTKLIRNSSTGRWSYSGAPVQWGAASVNDRYTFFAYAPFATAQNGIEVNINAPLSGIPTLTYSAPTNVVNQPDLMFAVPRYNLSSASGMVSLQLKHALTCVGFQVQGNGEKIKSLTIKGVYAAGTAKIDGQTIVWSYANQPPTPLDYSPSLNFDAGQTYVTAGATMSTNLIAGNGYLMMVPQALTANSKLIITFSDNTTYELSLDSQIWAAGKRITYNIIITPDGILLLSPANFYIPARGVSHTTDNLLLTCAPADLKWTVRSDATWMRLTLNSDGSSASTTVTGRSGTTIYTVADPNTSLASRTVQIYVQNKTQRLGATIIQLGAIDLTAIKSGGERPSGISSYVGAFWRAAQNGERLIRIPVGTSSNATGKWVASVVWQDGQWLADDISFSIVATLDTGVSYTGEATPGDAEAFPVATTLTLASGSAVVNGDIYFRIGLKTAYVPTAALPARYAVVALTYKDLSKTQLILLRQGEGADFVMRKIDPATSGTGTQRPLASKISPYNLTQGQIADWTGGPLLTDHPLLPLRGGLFVEYPSQAGALFQWASTDNLRRAYHPVSPSGPFSVWSVNISTKYWKEGLLGQAVADLNEVCPAGYRRINDGSTTAAADMNAANSELRQSLSIPLVNGVSNWSDNIVKGYYADGFFDRRQIKNSVTGEVKTAVSFYPGVYDKRNAKVAYMGAVVYNPTTWASIFFPSAGIRVTPDGAFYRPGAVGCYWTTASQGVYNYATGYIFNESGAGMLGYEFTRGAAVNIRCVKD